MGSACSRRQRIRRHFLPNCLSACRPVLSPKPPRETVAELTKQIAAAPSRSDLVSLRAQEAELNLDFATADKDWKTFSTMSPDKQAGSVALADYYHRRLQPQEELSALLVAASQPSMGRDALNADSEQRSWELFKRAVSLVEAQALPLESAESVYNAWTARYPKQPQPYIQFVDFLIAARQPRRAEQVVTRYVRAFPQDEAFPLQARARLLPPAEALKLYEASFRPVLPSNVIAQYFELLKETRNLRTFLAKARSEVASNPNDLNAAAKLFYYYQQQGILPQAHRALLEYRIRRGQATASELLDLATLFEQTNNYVEAARSYQQLSRSPRRQRRRGLYRAYSHSFHGSRATIANRWRRYQFLQRHRYHGPLPWHAEWNSVVAIQLDGPAMALLGTAARRGTLLPSREGSRVVTRDGEAIPAIAASSLACKPCCFRRMRVTAKTMKSFGGARSFYPSIHPVPREHGLASDRGRPCSTRADISRSSLSMMPC